MPSDRDPLLPEPSPLSILNARPGPKDGRSWRCAAALAGLLLVGSGVFLMSSVGVPGLGGEGAVGPLPSERGTRKAFSSSPGSTAFARRGDDVRQDRMQLAAAGKGAGGAVLEGLVPEDGDGLAPFDILAPKDAGTGAGGARGGGSAKAGAGVIPPGAAGARGSAPSYPQLASSVNMRSMRSISSNAGLRGLSSGRSILRRIIGRGANTETPGSGTASAYGAAGAGSGSAESGPGGGAGLGGGNDANASEDGQASAAPNPGGGGGGGAGGETGPLPETPQEKIERLMREGAELEKKADKEKKYAQIQSAGGHQGPAKYHNDRSKKYREEARRKGDEASRTIAELTSGVEAAADPAGPTNAGGGSSGGSGGVEP